MPSSQNGFAPEPCVRSANPEEEEPRLRYGPLRTDSSRSQLHSTATRLCVSDKVLAVGHRNGSVELLDHLGNQVKVFKKHSREVTDLSFDDTSEYLASGSTDGTLAVYGLYSDEVQRIKVAAPVTAVALDPRYGTRKTREMMYGTAGGTLILSSKGWLGNKETALFTGRGPLRCARMSGTLLAWATDSGLRIYDTATHTRMGKLERPAAAAADPAAPCSLLWRGDRELFVSWGHHVTVLRVVGSLFPGEREAAPGRSLQIVASFDIGITALGAAPFGADIAVLTWGAPSDRLPTSSAAGAIVITSTTTADEAPSATACQPAATATTAAPPAAADGSPPAAADGRLGALSADSSVQQQQQQQAQQQGQPQPDAAAQQRPQEPPSLLPLEQLSLCFYSRSGQLLAADALGCSCSAAERRWHQLAFTYPGDADLRLAAAVAPALQRGSELGSAAGSIRGTPVKQRPASEADGSAAGEGTHSAAADGATGRQEPAAGDSQRHHREQQQHAHPVQQYKWWRDAEEPTYFICTPTEIIVGCPRDGNDRVAWLADRGRYAEALSITEEDRTVTAKVRAAVGEQYLQALVTDRRYEEAAALCPRVLQSNAMAWERWAFTFAQLRQLAVLAPHLPTDSPRLKASTYDLVLSSFLLHPADHGVLLHLVKVWPPHLYNASQLQSAILHRMGDAGDWPVLQQAAAQLYTLQGQYEEALRLMLQLHSLSVFDYIARHALIDRVSPLAAELIDLDEVRATCLLVEHCEEVPPGEVVAALQDAVAAAPCNDEHQRWRRRLHAYLDYLFLRDSQLGAAFSELQVELYAEFEPSRLLHFLMVSPSYPLERAYQVCEQRGLVREMVFVLGRMGSAEKALRLIVEGLRDVVQAVEFVQLQHDDELWEQLIALTLGDAQLTGALLDNAGGYIDPLRVVSQIPPHLRVDNLRERLVKIITDFRTQMSLQQGCNTILRHDCVVLANRLYRVLRCSLRRLHLKMQHSGGSRWVLYDSLTGEEMAEDDIAEVLLEGLGTEVPGADAPGKVVHSPSPGPAAAGAGSTPGSAQHSQEQQQQRVWVGFLGGPPAAAAGGPAAPPAQHSNRSPSKFQWLAGSSKSPARTGSMLPHNIALAS